MQMTRIIDQLISNVDGSCIYMRWMKVQFIQVVQLFISFTYAYLYIHSFINVCTLLKPVKYGNPSIDPILHYTNSLACPGKKAVIKNFYSINTARASRAACVVLRHRTVSSEGPLTFCDPCGVEFFISCPAGDLHAHQ